MKGIKLFTLLAALSPQEFKNLKKAVESPLFNTNIKTTNLYHSLRQSYPIFPTNQQFKTKIFRKIFGAIPYNDNQLRRVFTDLKIVVEEYLLYLENSQKEKHRKKMLLQIYKERNLPVFFEKNTLQLQAELDEKPFRDLEYYQEKFTLDFDYFFHPLTQKHTLEDEMLVRLMDSVDMQFALAKFRIGSEMKNRERILSKKYKIRFLDLVKSEIQNDFFEQNSTLQLFALLFEMYEPEKERTIFYQLKSLLAQEIKNLRRVDQSLFLTQLINYATRQINIGNADFYSQALDLYRIGLAQELVLDNKRINEAVFGNIVLLGCQAKEFNWTENFIQEYAIFLGDSIKEDTIALNFGIWHFYQNEFDKAHQKFTSHSFSLAFQQKVRLYLIRTVFELFLQDASYYDLLISQIEATEKFLHRSKLIRQNRKEANLNSILLLKKLATGVFKRKDLSQLKRGLLMQINDKKIFTFKKWLEEKCQ